MKSFLTLLLFVCSLTMIAQVKQKYLAGAVPLKQGYVEFKKKYTVPNKSQSEIFDLLLEHTRKTIVKEGEQVNQTRVTESTPEDGIIAASVEEFLYFKKSNFVSHGTRFFYQLLFNVENNGFTVTMRRIHYLYDGMDGTSTQVQSIRAENWITDAKALVKKGTKLSKMPGKFRKATIDRKDALFREAAIAVGADLPKKVVVVEEE